MRLAQKLRQGISHRIQPTHLHRALAFTAGRRGLALVNIQEEVDLALLAESVDVGMDQREQFARLYSRAV